MCGNCWKCENRAAAAKKRELADWFVASLAAGFAGHGQDAHGLHEPIRP
jgi:hypothetical protein